MHAPATAVEASTTVGVALFMDFFSVTNALVFLRLLMFGGKLFLIVFGMSVVNCPSLDDIF